MRGMGLALLLLLAVFASGCGRNRKAQATEPLTYETWQAYPAEKKYEISTIERLKNDNPKFADDREWNRFMKTVLVPGRKKELASK